MPVKMLTVVGARPQFVKAAALSAAIQKLGGIEESIVHTGQHYDAQMSDTFFTDLHIPAPLVNLGISGGSHGDQTGRMMQALEPVFVDQKPDLVLVYGDTNSTLAAALVASKMKIPVAHVEAGLRLYSGMEVPEEINRVLTDHVSTLLFCSSYVGVGYLGVEGITANVWDVGDVMLDTFQHSLTRTSSKPLSALGLTEDSYCVATIHRPDNVDDPKQLVATLEALDALCPPIVMPVHPRTSQSPAFASWAADRRPPYGALRLITPLPYLSMLSLMQRAKLVITDSGGVQKEAYWLGKPCVTHQRWTEWVELAEMGVNALTGGDPSNIRPRVEETLLRWQAKPFPTVAVYGDGHAAEAIVQRIKEWYASA